jgi:hypothetical protein
MSPLDPDVPDLAPSDPALTAYDEEHVITYVRMLDADAAGSSGSCCTSIRTANLVGRGKPSRAISPAPGG